MDDFKIGDELRKAAEQGNGPVEEGPDGLKYEDLELALSRGEVGIAELVAQQQRGRLCFDAIGRRWYEWAGHYWQKIAGEKVLEVVDPIRESCERQARAYADLRISATSAGDKDGAKEHARKERALLAGVKFLGDVSRRAEIMKMCRSDGSFLGYSGPWDANDLLLACPNGVLDLSLMEFRDGKPEDYIRTAVPTPWESFDAACPLWEKTLLEIFDGSEDTVEYLGRVLGYCITGLTNHHHLWIFEGDGRNGKGTITRILLHVLGDLVASVDRELVLARKNNRQSGAASPDVMQLRGKRLAIMSETAEGRKFDPGRLKWMSGGDHLVARGLYEKDHTTFRPTHKLILQTNHRPHISGSDFAAWQRILLFPFYRHFVEDPNGDPALRQGQADPYLEDKLREEAPGILAWLVRGWLRYVTVRLVAPPCIKAATKEYQREEDAVGRFFGDCVERYIGGRLRAGDAYAAFIEWCKKEGAQATNNRQFGKELRRFVEGKRDEDGTFYLDVRLRPGEPGM